MILVKTKKGISLAELIVVMAILVVLIVAAVASINPVALVNRARDAQRKKDLNRIKISFEDYYNDKGCYPNEELVTQMTTRANCGGKIFSPWLTIWPCDPNKTPYSIVVGYDSNCPKWYKILANLENKNDKDIPVDWVNMSSFSVGNTSVNYGVSSGNITVNQITAENDPYCVALGSCYYYPEANKCNKSNGCSGLNCYLGECSSRCKVDCCGTGCN